MQIFKIFGVQRSGTNFVKALIETNYSDSHVLGLVLGSKHVPATWRTMQAWRPDNNISSSLSEQGDLIEIAMERAQLRQLNFIFVFKEPISWILSYFRYRQLKQPKEYRALTAKMAREFLDHWADANRAFLSFQRANSSSSVIVNYHELLLNPEDLLVSIEDRFSVQRKADIVTTSIQWSMKRGTDRDHGESLFDRQNSFDREYYQRRLFLEHIDGHVLTRILERLDNVRDRFPILEQIIDDETIRLARARAATSSRTLPDVSPGYKGWLALLDNPKLAELGRRFLENTEWRYQNYPAWTFDQEFDWCANPFEDRTWTWGLHQWAFVPSLIAYDIVFNATRGLEKAINLARGWWAAQHDRSKAAPMAWHDHGTALRARNILLMMSQLAQHAPRYGQLSEAYGFLQIIAEHHGQMLMSDEFYSVGTNHGLDQSVALYELSKELTSWHRRELATAVARQRLSDEVSTAFADDGGHVENSPGYQNYGLVQAQTAIACVSSYGEDADSVGLTDELFDRAAMALAFMIRPDGTLPHIGDTAHVKVRDIFTVKQPASHKQFLYATSKGGLGIQPDSTDLVLPTSGWSIFRSDWRPGRDFADAVHIVFKAGFKSRYHRHDDDLSFVLYAFGSEWLIDGGLYKHHPADPMRKYCRSADAHNLSAPLGVKASRDISQIGSQTRIASHETDGRKSRIVGVSGMFKGFESSRRLIYDRETNEIDVQDRLLAQRDLSKAMVSARLLAGKQTFVTRFLIPDDKHIEVHAEEGRVVISANDGRALVLQTASTVGPIRVTKGASKPHPKGWRSAEVGVVRPAFCLEIFHAMEELDFNYKLSLS